MNKQLKICIKSIVAPAMATLCTALFVPVAIAVDGETLINQAAVNAGGITPGDAAGYPATLTRPGRYKLNGNLVVPAGQIGISVTVSDVTVDLNGFTIRSASPGESGIGVFAQPASANRLRVMNGTITGFGDFGISNRQSFGAESAIIENMRVLANRGGIFIGPRAQIRDSTIANSQGGNISCAHSCLIERNMITGSAGGAGIAITGGTVLGNVIVGNGFLGVAADVTPTGLGNNILIGNNSGGPQVDSPATQMHPNACEPACP